MLTVPKLYQLHHLSKKYLLCNHPWSDGSNILKTHIFQELGLETDLKYLEASFDLDRFFAFQFWDLSYKTLRIKLSRPHWIWNQCISSFQQIIAALSENYTRYLFKLCQVFDYTKAHLPPFFQYYWRQFLSVLPHTLQLVKIYALVNVLKDKLEAHWSVGKLVFSLN